MDNKGNWQRTVDRKVNREAFWKFPRFFGDFGINVHHVFSNVNNDHDYCVRVDR